MRRSCSFGSAAWGRGLRVTVLMASMLAVAAESALARPLSHPTVGGGSPQNASANSALRVFLDCPSCDQDFLRTEITLVDFVRDRRDAQVHILVTTQPAGGGTEYTMTFTGQAGFAGTDLTLRYVSSQTDTVDEIRRAIARRIRLGLAPFLAGTPVADLIDLTGAGATRAPSLMTQPEDDPWKAWLFRASGDTSLDAEQAQKLFAASGALSASRTTRDWKVLINARANYRKDEYDLGDSTTYTDKRNDWNATTLVVKSVGDHWGIGTGGSVISSTFVNQAHSLRVAQAVEYNVFPYAESTTRQLTVTYALGVNHFRYEEESIFGKTSETLADHTLTGSLNLSRRWGGALASVEWAQFLSDASKHRLVALSNVDVRIARGLSLNIVGSTSLIRDQVYLVRGGASPEEILVRRRQLATDYQRSLVVGISYTFGSIYNNVVNSRFMGSAGGVIRRF